MENDLTNGIAQALANWKPRMVRAGIRSIYAFVAAAALYPVARALQSGDSAALQQVAMLMAGVGTNLLANLLQVSRDEADLARRIESLKSNAPEHAEIAGVMNKADSLKVAASALSKDEHDAAVVKQMRQKGVRV